MNLQVREARRQDMDMIVSFNAAMALETEKKELDLNILRSGVNAVLDDPRKGVYFIATIGSEIAGQLMITTEWSDWRNGTFWWIQSVYVGSAFRRQGVYRRLHDHVLNRARRNEGVCGVRLYVDKSNQAAQSTYRTLGMSPTHYDLYEIDFGS